MSEPILVENFIGRDSLVIYVMIEQETIIIPLGSLSILKKKRGDYRPKSPVPKK